MRTRFLTLLTLGAVLALLGTLMLSSVAFAAETTLTTTLAGGDAEVPPGDPDGSGTASVVIDPDAGSVCYEITVENIEPATASHIHAGAAGVAGSVVVPLDTDGFEGTTEGCTEGQDAAALQGIIDDPGSFYVNVHTADFGGGAVRGQLAAATVPNTALPASGGSSTMIGFVLLALALIAGAWRLAAERR